MNVRQLVFKYRSYTPIPFIVVMLVFANPTLEKFFVGFFLVTVGEAIRFWGVAIAGSETRTTETLAGKTLVTSGPFAYVRNPLYIGNMLMYVGFAIMSNALSMLFPLFVLIFFLLQYNIIVSLEEEYLAGKFGVAYHLYCNDVQRFFPRMTKRVSIELPQPKFDFTVALQSETRTLQAFGLLTAALLLRWKFLG